jgi:hypothetical protein
VSTLQRVTTSDEGRIRQAAFKCAFVHVPSNSETIYGTNTDAHVYCFIRRETDQVCIVYGTLLGGYLFPLSTYKKELSYLASLTQRLMESTICTAIEAIIIHGEEQLAKQFSL